MVQCPKCGYLNAEGSEFCQNPDKCGTFLGYDGKKLEPLPGTVLLTLPLDKVTVAPGSQASAQLRVRNKSTIVDQYEIQLAGDPSAWTLVEPAVVSLFPDNEAAATLQFRPPKTPDVAAGQKMFTVTVQSKASPQISARQDGTIDVAPFVDAALSITPQTARGDTTANYRVLVQNRGNVPLRATLEAADPNELLDFQLDRPALTLAPKEAATVQLVVSPHAVAYEGSPQPHPFKVELRADGLGPRIADATFVQEAVPRPVPRKLPVVSIILALLALAILGTAAVEHQPISRFVAQLINGPTPTLPPSPPPSHPPSTPASPTPSPSPSPSPIAALVQVPNVSCMTASVAQQVIENAGFRFAGTFVANAFYQKDVVFKTQPLGGGQAPQGTEITAFISTGAPSGVVQFNQCSSIIRVIPSGLLILPSHTP